MLKIAHRGASAYKPENTLAAFAKALAMGADGIELDVHLAKTGEPVVIHDETVDRTTNGKGRVQDKSLKALQELVIGENQKISTLEEVLDFVDNRAMVFIEIKAPGAAKPVGELIERLVHSGKWPREKLIVISFDFEELRKLKKLFPKIRAGVTFDKVGSLEEAYEMTQGIDPYSFNIRVDNIDEKLLKEIHSRGQKVYVWTANEQAQIDYAKSIGVDGVMSDYPDRLN